MYVCMYACMDGWMDGWMNEWINDGTYTFMQGLFIVEYKQKYVDDGQQLSNELMTPSNVGS